MIEGALITVLALALVVVAVLYHRHRFRHPDEPAHLESNEPREAIKERIRRRG